MRRGDIVNVLYKHELWHTVGVVSHVWGKDSIQVTLLFPKHENYIVGAFQPDELELLGHIELEEGEKR